MKSEVKKMNWTTELNVHDKEVDSKTVSKVKAIECELISKHNYRWYKVNQTYMVLIPCDENGEPTEKGIEKIKKHKEMLNIV